MVTRNTLLGLALCAHLGACATSLDRVRDTVAAAPDWYDERAAEVRGEGYPDIGRIPNLTAQQRAHTALDEGRADVQSAEDLFRMDPRSIPPGLELAEMLEWARAARAEADAIEAEPGDHLTPEDVRLLRALFERARARS